MSPTKPSKTCMCWLLWHPAWRQALLGVEAVPAGCRKRDSGFQRTGMPGSGSQLPAACFLSPSTATALLETLSAPQHSQPSHQHCPAGSCEPGPCSHPSPLLCATAAAKCSCLFHRDGEENGTVNGGDDAGTGAMGSSATLPHLVTRLLGNHSPWRAPSRLSRLQLHPPGRGLIPAGFGLTELCCLRGTRLSILCLPTLSPSHHQRPTRRLPSKEWLLPAHCTPIPTCTSSFLLFKSISSCADSSASPGHCHWRMLQLSGDPLSPKVA